MLTGRHHVSRSEEGEPVEDFLATGLISMSKTARPADSVKPAASHRELRLMRDMVWAMLAAKGLSPSEISRVCKLAGRSPVQVWRRLNEFHRAYGHDSHAG